MILQMLLALAVGSFAGSPEAFLDSLCSHSSGEGAVAYWQSCADPAGTNPPAHSDTIRAILSARTGLTVEPGEDLMNKLGDTRYVSVFPESKWSWTDADGSSRIVRGRTEVAFLDGRFYWRSLPLSPGREGAAVSSSSRILMGMMFTIVVLVVAVLALWWTKRRWG